MAAPKELYYEKRGRLLVENLKKRHFEACYCATKAQALAAALAWIPEGSSVGWGGATSAAQIGLLDAVKNGNYNALDRDSASSAQERTAIMEQCLHSDVFIAGANAMSLDGQMVTVDGNGNRMAAIVYGPKRVVILVGMNKVADTLEAAVSRARMVAAPMNQQRFLGNTPCSITGVCGDCKSDDCICNQILVTRNCRPAGRICFVVVGEELGF